MEVEVVAVAPDIVLATMWRDVLSDNGVEAEIAGSGLSSVYPGIGALGGGYQVLVRADDATMARRLLDEAAAACASLEADPDACPGPLADTDGLPDNDADAEPDPDPDPDQGA